LLQLQFLILRRLKRGCKEKFFESCLEGCGHLRLRISHRESMEEIQHSLEALVKLTRLL
jgi:hypothetical protein